MNQYYLLQVLAHVIRGQELLQQQSTFVPPPESPVLLPVTADQPKVLVADDNEFCKNAVRRLMQRYTSRITTCADGLKALIVFKNEFPNFDIAVLDYQMPQIDGISLISAMRNHEAAHGECKKRVTILCMIMGDIPAR